VITLALNTKEVMDKAIARDRERTLGAVGPSFRGNGGEV
jgi:hypothetical protein